MNKIVTIYCEGVAGSHDYDIISKVVDDLTVRIEPIGGKKGAGSAIQVYEKLATKSDFFLMFRDRDFDDVVPNSPKLTLKGKNIYLSYRTTIENYLFDTSVFYNFIRKEDLELKFNIRCEADVKKIFIVAAKNIKYYQATRHTLGLLRTEKATFNTTWTDGSGQLPESLDIDYCKQKGIEKITEAKSHTDNWSIEIFNHNYNDFLSRFNDQFFEQLEFLIWFQGKDFASSLSKELNSFPMKKYYKFAKDKFTYLNHNDLIELRSLIEANQ